MEKRYSPISDLYGFPPEEEPPKERSYGWLYVLLLILGIFVYGSLQPALRLRHKPPPGFMSATSNSAGANRGAGERMASLCWDYALRFLENAYPYGQPLPQAPVPGLEDTPAIRMVCWPDLRKAWEQPESWERVYVWDTDWLTNPQGDLQKFFRRLWDALR